MPVEVLFRGPILVVHTPTEVRHLLVPDADTDTGKHPDDTKANRHFARMFMNQSGTTGLTSTIRGMDVSIDDGSGGSCGIDGSIQYLVALDEIVSAGPSAPYRLVAPDSDSVASAITLHGGSLGSSVLSRNQYEIPSPVAPRVQEVNLVTRWTTAAAEVRLTFTQRTQRTQRTQLTQLTNYTETTVVLRGDDKAYFYNFDIEHVTKDVFEAGQPRNDGPNWKEDPDFKWHYHLLDIAPSEFKGLFVNGHLPAPRCRWNLLENALVTAEGNDCVSSSFLVQR